MRAMDYLSSSSLCYLVCDALSLLDKRPIEHGMRVAYILLQLLSAKKDLDEYEIAEFVFLGMLHDIGAYKTEKLSTQTELTYDDGDEDATAPHSVYGALFLENVSPFTDRAEILFYHHWPYNKLSRMGYKYDKICSYLHLAEEVDKAYLKDGLKIDLHAFEPKAGQDYVADSVMLLMKCVRRNDMLVKIKNGKYLDELKSYLEDNILFTNEEKEGYLRLVMYIYSLREKARSMEAIICSCITDEIAEDMELISREKEKLEYAALLRDIGMLSVDIKLINAPRKLTEEEMEEVKDHVAVTEQILSKYFLVKDVVDIAVAHHEKLDGLGYPRRLRESQMKKSQMILQVADTITAMMSPRKHREQLTKSDILEYSLKMATKKRFSDEVVKALQNRFDNIEKRIESETKEYLELHNRINTKYKFMIETHMGRQFV